MADMVCCSTERHCYNTISARRHMLVQPIWQMEALKSWTRPPEADSHSNRWTLSFSAVTNQQQCSTGTPLCRSWVCMVRLDGGGFASEAPWQLRRPSCWVSCCSQELGRSQLLLHMASHRAPPPPIHLKTKTQRSTVQINHLANYETQPTTHRDGRSCE